MKSKSSQKTKTDFRRREAERRRDEQRELVWRTFLAQFRPLVVLIWLGFYAGCVTVLIWGGESMPWNLNEKVDRDITARVEFTVVDKLATQDKLTTAKASAPNVFVFKEDTVELIREQLVRLGEIAFQNREDPTNVLAQATNVGWTLDVESTGALLSLMGETDRAAYDKMVEDLLAKVRVQHIVERPNDPNRKSTPTKAILRNELGAPEIAENQLIYANVPKAVEAEVQRFIGDVESVPVSLRGPIVQMLTNIFSGFPKAEKPTMSPLWRYSAELTAEEMDRAESRTEPITITRKEGTILVQSGTDLGRTELALLNQEHEAYLQKGKSDPALRLQKVMTQFGIGVLVLLLTLGLVTYIANYQRRIFEKPARTLGLCGLLWVMVLLSRLLEGVSGQWNAPLEFSIGFVVIASALLTIAYNQRFALGMSMVLAILVTLASRGDFGLFLTMLVSISITVFLLREVRTRSKMVGVGIAAAFGAFLASAATGVFSHQELKYILVHAGSAALAVFLAGFIVQGMLHYYERIFGIATSMTLLEWCDASRPLLRRLAQEAPGTYSHSLVLSQMAEEASEVVGANGLLARVGALYHDIGKIQKAEYFVENQVARMNRHDRLSPTMSLLIIVGHVKDGMEMAKAYGLPRVLHQFIAEHHGSTVVKYFHHVASEAAAKNTTGKHDREVPESEFRYPGPKPQSKETAILMLCDSCEGAVRSLSEPTSTRIESMIHQVFMDRLRDGQFDECDITLRELHLVEQSLVKSLCAIHHGRVKYPKGGGDSASAKAKTDKVSMGETPSSTGEEVTPESQTSKSQTGKSQTENAGKSVPAKESPSVTEVAH